MMPSKLFARTSRAYLVYLAVLLLAPVVPGQTGRGGITGLITDPSGGVIPGATVQIVNVATGFSQDMQSSSAGLYFFTALVPGTYRVTASYQGFQKVVRDSIPVEVDRVSPVNIELRPGEVTETVTVVAEPVLTNTTNSTIGQLIDSKALDSVPINGRNVFLLVQLTPGVVPINGAVNQTGAFTRPGVEVSALNINGGQAGSVAYMLDGSPLTVDGYGAGASSPAFTPPLDAVQEFRMQSSNLFPSYASPGTGVISLVSKSGGEQFHGSAFYFARPNALASNDPFLKASQARSGRPNEPPDFHRYQWGGSIGGPIRRGKLFFFGDYEGTQTRTLETLSTTVPTAAEKAGDFLGVPTIYDPFTLDAAGQRQPFPNNMIPRSLRNPVAVNIQELIPPPNQPGTGRYHQNNYFDGSTYPNDAQKFDVRLDHYFSSKHQMFGRYSFARMVTGNADHYHNGADPVFYFSITRGQNVVLADNYTLSPTTLLQLRYSFTRHAENQPVTGAARDFDMTKLGLPASLAQQSVLPTIPRMEIAGLYGVGSRPFATGFKFISQNHDVIVSLDKVHGRHKWKTGFEYRKSFVNMGQPVAPSGWYQFDTTATSSRTFAGNGYGYASFILGTGTPTSTANSFTIDPFIAHASPYYGSYLQDNIQVTQNLTVDVGVRWEIFGGRTERYDRQTYFDPDILHTVNGVELRGGLLFPKNNSSPFETGFRNAGPRVGVAYRVRNRGVIHAGFGIFFGPTQKGVAIAASNSDSFSSRTAWQAVRMDAFGNTVMLNPLNNPFPDGITRPTQGSLGLATNLGSNLQTVFRSEPVPAAYNWNAGVQYELPRGYLVSGAWVGSRGLHQIANVDLNQLSLDQLARFNTSLNETVPNPFVNAVTDPASPFYRRATIARWQAITNFPQFGTGSPSAGVVIRDYGLANSIYHSLQFKVEKRLSAHFSTLASLTLGKLIGTGSGPYAYIGQHGGPQNWKSLHLDRAVDPQDVSRWFSWAAFYDLPVGRGRAINTSGRLANLLVGGWAINSVFFWGTGVPIIVSGTWPNRSIFMNQRPDLTCDPAAGAPETSSQWFLPNCFSAPVSPFVAGTAPRTLPNLRADGAFDIDFSIFKNFFIGEGRNLQIRAEAFNLTNSVQLGLPNARWNPIDLSTFGSVTTAASSPRQLQFAARFTF
jgi:hypothetical protein